MRRLVLIIALSLASMAVAQDAVQIAPQHYKVIFENDRVRALEFRSRPGQVVAMHAHPPLFIYSLSHYKIRHGAPDGTFVDRESRRGDSNFIEASSHTSENIGKTEVHALLVELKERRQPSISDSGAPYSDAVRVGNLLFLSGKLGTAPGTRQVVPGGIEAETRQALENIKRVLEANGSSLDRVAKCTVMLADIKDWEAMNGVYRTYLTQKPARSTFGANGLALNARVEIECIATVP